MRPKRIPFFLYITFFLITIFSCQKKSSLDAVENNRILISTLITKADQFNKNCKNTDSAFFYYNKAKLLCNPKIDTENYVSILNNMAEIQLNHGDYIGSETTITAAIPYLKYITKSENIWNTYTTLGTNYLYTYDYTNALLNYNKALGLKTDEWRKQSTKSNIAWVLMKQKKYDEALQIFLRLSTKKETQKKREIFAKVIDNIGVCYFRLDDPRGIQYLNQGLKIRTEIDDKLGIAISKLHLARYYDENHNALLSKKNALGAYTIFNQLHHIERKQSSLKILIKNSSDDELKKYSLLYVNLIDSIYEVRQKAKNQFAKIKYDSKLEKEENLKLKTSKAENDLKLERQKNRNIISYIIIALSLCMVLILYFYLTSKSNREKIEATYRSETRISKKLHDELANDIYHTMAFAENKNLALNENKEQLLQNLYAIYARTRDISKENGIITTDENYISSLKEMISGFSTPNINLILNGIDTISWNEVDKNKKITLYRVLQELLVNMRKYSEATLVGINFKKTEKSITVNYTDNGKGIESDKIVFKNGLYNVEYRILKIKGEVEIKSTKDHGFKVFFKFPI
jgi:signal transduction histidine kinase